jgi:hypothetical protein
MFTHEYLFFLLNLLDRKLLCPNLVLTQMQLDFQKEQGGLVGDLSRVFCNVPVDR